MGRMARCWSSGNTLSAPAGQVVRAGRPLGGRGALVFRVSETLRKVPTLCIENSTTFAGKSCVDVPLCTTRPISSPTQDSGNIGVDSGVQRCWGRSLKIGGISALPSGSTRASLRRESSGQKSRFAHDYGCQESRRARGVALHHPASWCRSEALQEISPISTARILTPMGLLLVVQHLHTW